MSEEEMRKMLDGILNTAQHKGVICSCGTVEDAILIAGTVLKQVYTSNGCLVWYLQLAEAMRLLGVMAMMQYDGVPLEALVALETEKVDRALVKKMDDAAKVPVEIATMMQNWLSSRPDGYVPTIYDTAHTNFPPR